MKKTNKETERKINKDGKEVQLPDYNYNLEKRIDMLRDKIIETTNFIKNHIDR